MTTNFGRDTSCLQSLRTGRFVSGVRLVAEAAYRRLTTPRGMLRGGEAEANYGLDLLDMLGKATTAALKAAMPGRIENELEKDERIETSRATILESKETNGAVTWDITIDCETAEGPFALQLRVSEVTIELLGMSLPEAA